MKIFDKIFKFLYASLFFFTPLIFTASTSELFEFNKMIFIYLITVLVSFFWLLKMILAKKLIIKKTLLDIPIILFLLSQILSTIFSIDNHVSLFGYYGRFNGGLLSIISYILLYYGLVSNLENLDFILKSSLFSSLIVILYGLPGKFGHDLTCFFVSQGRLFDNSCWSTETNIFNPKERVFSTLGQPNWFAAYLAINFFIAFYFFVKNIKNPKYFILNTFYLIVNFSFILFSRSKSAFGAVIIGIILIVIYYLLIVKKNLKKIIITLLMIAIIPTLLFKTGIAKIDKYLSISNIKNQKSKIKLENQKKVNNLNITDSLDIRKIVWKGAINLGLKYPLLGTGVETFAYSYYFVRPVEHNLTSEWDYVYNKAHNEFLNYLATTGFTGLMTYLILVGSTLYFFISKIKHQKSKTYLFILISYLTILITNFFGFSTTTINLFFYLIPAFIFSFDKKNISDEDKSSYKKLNFFQYFFILIIFIFSAYILYSIYSYWRADNFYALGLNYSKPQVSDYQKSAAFFEKALKIRSESVYEDRFSSSLAYLAFFAAYQKQNNLSDQLRKISQYYNEKTILKSPKNIFFLKTKAKNQYLFYDMTLDKDYLLKGIEALKNSQKLAPTDPKIPYSLAFYYSRLYDSEEDIFQKKFWKDKSLKEIELALKLKNDFQEALTLKQDLLKKYHLPSQSL